MNNKGKGILALIGLAGGAFAYWKYRNMSQEEKDAMKAKLNKTGDKIKESVADVEMTISEKYDQLKNSAKKHAKDIAS